MALSTTQKAVSGAKACKPSKAARSVACKIGTSPRSAALRRGLGLRLLRPLSRAVELQGMTTRYEEFAGRSAMLGTTTALVIEVVSGGQSLFVDSVDSLVLLSVGLGALTLAVALAVQRHIVTKGIRTPTLLEPVMTSLTAVKRAASSITLASSANVDRAVDELLSTVFSAESIREMSLDTDLAGLNTSVDEVDSD